MARDYQPPIAATLGFALLFTVAVLMFLAALFAGSTGGAILCGILLAMLVALWAAVKRVPNAEVRTCHHQHPACSDRYGDIASAHAAIRAVAVPPEDRSPVSALRDEVAL